MFEGKTFQSFDGRLEGVLAFLEEVVDSRYFATPRTDEELCHVAEVASTWPPQAFGFWFNALLCRGHRFLLIFGTYY